MPNNPLKHILSKKNRALLRELVVTDFKLRYQGSVLGYVWSLLRPLMLFLILYVVFVKFLKLDYGIPHNLVAVYLLLGIVLWNFFAEMTSQSLSAIVSRGDLIRKIRIPRWIIIVSSSFSALINFGLNLIVVAVFMVVSGMNILSTSVLLPFILIEVYILALGCSLFLSAAYVKFRDVGYIWEVVLQLMFYVTPLLYPLSRITNVAFQKLLLLNPMAQSVQDARHALVSHDIVTTHAIYAGSWLALLPYLLPVLVLIGGLLYFKKEAKYFAENI